MSEYAEGDTVGVGDEQSEVEFCFFRHNVQPEL
jgi:hypothetical protein